MVRNKGGQLKQFQSLCYSHCMYFVMYFALAVVAGKTLASHVPKKYVYICPDHMGKT